MLTRQNLLKLIPLLEKLYREAKTSGFRDRDGARDTFVYYLHTHSDWLSADQAKLGEVMLTSESKSKRQLSGAERNEPKFHDNDLIQICNLSVRLNIILI